MKKDINHIISKVLNNEASSDDISFFSRWLAQREENIAEFEKLKCFWDAKVSNENTICGESSFIRLEERIRDKKKKRNYFLYKLSVACSILLIAGFFSVLYFMNGNSGEKEPVYSKHRTRSMSFMNCGKNPTVLKNGKI